MAVPQPSIHLCLFAKPPRPGQVKTRLAADLGAQRAAELARAFLEDCWAGLSALDWAEPVLASTGALTGLDDLDPARQLWDQGVGDLGARLAAADAHRGEWIELDGQSAYLKASPLRASAARRYSSSSSPEKSKSPTSSSSSS